MPNHHCCVPGCSADSRKDTSRDKYRFLRGVTFHAFPREPEDRDLWLRLMKRDDYVPNRYSRVCSLHFTNKKGPTPDSPCPTVFAHNQFSGEIPEDLATHVSETVARALQRESLRSPRLVVMDSHLQLAGGNARRDVMGNARRDVTGNAQRDVTVDARRDVTGNARRDVTGNARQEATPEARRDVTGSAGRDVTEEKRQKEVEEARREVMTIAVRRRQQQEELKRVQAEIMAKAAANAQLLASINEAEKAGQIQLIDEADIKAIQAATQSVEQGDDGDMDNPYRFINENTDLMWQMGSGSSNTIRNSGQVLKKVEGEEGGWEVVPVGPGGKKRRHEEVERDEARDEVRDETRDGPEEDEDEEDESSSEEDEEEEGGENTSSSDTKKTEQKNELPTEDVIMAAVAEATALEEELNEQMLRPPLHRETPEISQLRERLTLRGPHHNYLPKPRCKFCNLFFQSIDSLLGHLYRHTDRPYQCVECGATFRKAEELETHIEVHRHREAETSYYYRVLGTKHGILECPVESCTWHSWGGIRVFSSHIRQHNKGCCILCGEGVHGGSEPHFMKHVKKHMSWTMRMKCPMCPTDKQALQRKLLESHIKTQHAAEIKPWACYHCDNHKIIPRFCDLDYHLLKNHSSNPYECQYCGAAYPSLYGLRCHARKHHKRGKEHDTKYEWVEVVHNQDSTKEMKLPSTRKSNTYQKVSMMPQTGDRQMQNQSQQSSVMSLFTSPVSKMSLPPQLQSPKMAMPQIPRNLLTIPQVKPPVQTLKIPVPKPSEVSRVMTAATSTVTTPSAMAAMSAAAAGAGSKQHYMRKYKPQKVCVMQKDGSMIQKTLLLPVDDGQLVSQVPPGAKTQVCKTVIGGTQEKAKLPQSITKLPTSTTPQKFTSLPSNMKVVTSPAGIKIPTPLQRTASIAAPPSKPAASQSVPQAVAGSSTGIPQVSLADLASGNIPGGIDVVDESILESLGISSQDLELGPVAENEDNPGWTITEVRGDIDFGALPDDGINDERHPEAPPMIPSLLEDKEDKALMKVHCPYKACTETFDTAVGFWRRHYLKLHFKRSDLYEFMCRDCGELFANWDWPPEDHDCNKPRWACICADCGDIFENQRYKHAHYPDCITFQKYTPAKAATVITARTCLYCHTTLKSVAELCNHLRVAHVSRRFNSLSIFCFHCEDFPTFPKADALWNHYKAKHLEWWKSQPMWVCNKCGETHQTEYDLTKHAVYTHAEEVTPSFLCNQCPYVFGQKCLFDMHKKIAHKD